MRLQFIINLANLLLLHWCWFTWYAMSAGPLFMAVIRLLCLNLNKTRLTKLRVSNVVAAELINYKMWCEQIVAIQDWSTNEHDTSEGNNTSHSSYYICKACPFCYLLFTINVHQDLLWRGFSPCVFLDSTSFFDDFKGTPALFVGHVVSILLRYYVLSS